MGGPTESASRLHIDVVTSPLLLVLRGAEHGGTDQTEMLLKLCSSVPERPTSDGDLCHQVQMSPALLGMHPAANAASRLVHPRCLCSMAHSAGLVPCVYNDAYPNSRDCPDCQSMTAKAHNPTVAQIGTLPDLRRPLRQPRDGVPLRSVSYAAARTLSDVGQAACRVGTEAGDADLARGASIGWNESLWQERETLLWFEDFLWTEIRTSMLRIEAERTAGCRDGRGAGRDGTSSREVSYYETTSPIVKLSHEVDVPQHL